MDKYMKGNGKYVNTSFKINIRDLLMYVILLFPITSIIKVYFEPLNLILTGLCFFLLTYYYGYVRGMNRKELVIFFYSVIIVNCVICRMKFYSVNMLFYFPFLIIYFMFFIKNQEYIINFIKTHKKYINAILVIWNIMIIISLFLPSSYVYEGETRAFVSFAGTTFLLAPIAMFIFALSIIQYRLYKNKIYAISLIIPSICILFGSTRTYLIGLMCAWLIFIYVSINKKRLFPIILTLGVILFIAIVLISPIKNKFIDAINRTKLGLDPLEAFTSGRSKFWSYDMKCLLNNPWYKIWFGNGNNYLFYLNDARFHVPLWAHNDYLQIFSDYGIIGLLIYIYVIFYTIKSILSKKKSFSLVAVIILMWAFIAFFNMFYTYFCVTLAFPFYILIVRYDEIWREK